MKRIEILDYNTPPFVTFDTTYFVQEEDFLRIQDKLEHCKEYPAKLLKTKRYEYQSVNQKAANGYNCETKFLMENVIADFAWIESEEKYYRCYKLTCDLKRFCDFREKYIDDITIWGNQVIEIENNNHLKSHVYHIQKCFDTKKEAYQDIETFRGKAKFSRFLEDVLGEAG